MNEPVLQNVAAGDSDAVRTCVSRYGGLVWSLARRMFRDTTETEDAVQEVFIQLWRKAELFDPARAAESTFVGTLARNKLIDLLRTKQRQAAKTASVSVDAEGVSDEIFDPTAVVTDHLEQADELDQIQRCWKNLSTEVQNVLALSIYDGLSYSQIADRLQLPLGTVKTRARMGLKSLRACYATNNHDFSGSNREVN